MTDLHIWIYFWVLVGYLVAGFIKGWNTAYLIVGAVVFVPVPIVVWSFNHFFIS